MKNIWQLQDAKSKFSELVDHAIKDGAQIVTRHGQKVVVVMAYEAYEKITRHKGNLSDFLLNSPLAGADIAVERDDSLPRDIDIDL